MSANNAANLCARFQELNAATSRDAAELAAQGKRATVRMLVFRPLGAFLQNYFGQKRWKKGIAGLVEAMFAAYEVFVRHAKLWELHNTTEPIPPPRS